MVSLRVSMRLRKSSLGLQKQLSLVKKTRIKKSITPTIKHISAKHVKKSPITVEEQESVKVCLLSRTSTNRKTPSIRQKTVKRTRKSTPIKQTSGMSSPRRTRRSVKISQQRTIKENIQDALNIRSPTTKHISVKRVRKSITVEDSLGSVDFRLDTQVKIKNPFIPLVRIPFHTPMKQISDKTFSHHTRSLPIKSLAALTNETAKFSPRRTRSSQKWPSEDTCIPSKQTSDSSPQRTRKSLRILQQKTSSETLCVTPTDVSSKEMSLTCSEKQILPVKRARTSQNQKSSKRARKSSITPKNPAKKVQAKTGHQRKSSVNFQKQASQTKKSSASNNRIVNKYKKDLENIPIDNLSLKHSSLCKRKAKSADYKLPKRTSLKQKRFTISEMKKADENYEDDIYEFKEFKCFKELMLDSPASVFSASMRTPVLGFQATPLICGKKTPKFKDCFSPRDLSIKRKAALEYIHRIKNRKRPLKARTPVVPEKKRLEFDEAISEGLKIQEAGVRLAESDDEEENNDDYFSDL